MAYTPDMPTQVKLFVLRSRERTADIQRRSSMNQTVDAEYEHRARTDAQGWKTCLLKEGQRQAQNIVQLWCVLEANKSALNVVADTATHEVYQSHLQELQSDPEFSKKTRAWFEGALFHNTFETTGFKGVSGKTPPLQLNYNTLIKRGRDVVKSILTSELHTDASNHYEYMKLASALGTQAKRNRATMLDYGVELWIQKTACTRTIASVAQSANSSDLLTNFDNHVYEAYTHNISNTDLPQIMVQAFSALCNAQPCVVEKVFVAAPAVAPKI